MTFSVLVFNVYLRYNAQLNEGLLCNISFHATDLFFPTFVCMMIHTLILSNCFYNNFLLLYLVFKREVIQLLLSSSKDYLEDPFS